MKGKILIAGIGNIFHADDGFGVEVVQRLAARVLPECVDVVDFGIRGIDLAFAIQNPEYSRVVLVDAVQRGWRPGTVYVIEPDLANLGVPPTPGGGAHAMDPASVLSWVMATIQVTGGSIGRVQLVGCEPAELPDGDELKMGLSAPVLSAVDSAIRAIEELIQGALNECTS